MNDIAGASCETALAPREIHTALRSSFIQTPSSKQTFHFILAAPPPSR